MPPVLTIKTNIHFCLLRIGLFSFFALFPLSHWITWLIVQSRVSVPIPPQVAISVVSPGLLATDWSLCIHLYSPSCLIDFLTPSSQQTVFGLPIPYSQSLPTDLAFVVTRGTEGGRAEGGGEGLERVVLQGLQGLWMQLVNIFSMIKNSKSYKFLWHLYVNSATTLTLLANLKSWWHLDSQNKVEHKW